MATNFAESDIFKRTLEIVQEFLDRCQERCLGWHIVNWIDSDRHPLESPIEAVFSVWWIAFNFGSSSESLYLLPQQKVTLWVDGVQKDYRLDFAVRPGEKLFQYLGDALGLSYRVAVEIDGHEFHERTKEQVAQRNTRDRDLQRSGWRVFHVSGSELYRDPETVVAAIYRGAEEELYVLRAEIVKNLVGKDIKRFE